MQVKQFLLNCPPASRHLFGLSLAGNRISEVGEAAFDGGAPDLQNLNLARNNIARFGAKTFTSLKKLR